MDAERVRILYERGEEQLERVLWMSSSGEMPRQRETRAPILRSLVDQPAAEIREALGRTGADRDLLESVEREVRAVGGDVDHPLPNLHGFLILALRDADVAEIEVRRHGSRIETDRAFETAGRLRIILAPQRLESDLVLQKRENRLILRLGVRQLRKTLPRVVRVVPLVL